MHPGLPSNERILLGPGPSLIAPRIMRAMAAPVLSHLDPDLVMLLDDVRARLGRVFKAPEGSLTIAMSGTGTSGMEAMVANLVGDELGVSLDTVRSHIRSIYRKLQVHSVAEAVSRALRERLV